MSDAAAPSRDAPPSRPARRGRSVVVAAGVTAALASIVVATTLIGRSGRSRETPRSTPAQLAVSAKAVAARHPEMKTEIEPLAQDELTRAPDEPLVSCCGISGLEPVGATMSDRPTIRWLRSTNATGYRIRITNADDGVIALTTTTTDDHLDFPAHESPLHAGARYEARVEATIPSRPATDERRIGAITRFRVLPVPHRSRWRTVIGDVESNEPVAIRELLLAHGAYRRGLYAEARHRAETFAVAHPNDEAVRPIVTALRRILKLDDSPTECEVVFDHSWR